MLTLPKIVKRTARPYVAVREKVRIPFSKAIGRAVPKMFDWAGQHKLKPAGPLFFKYNLIAMPDLEIDFGLPTRNPVTGDSEVVSGVLPAGRYVTMTHFGHYRHLMDVTAMLIGWAKERGIQWDVEQTPEGDRFASRFEVYPNGPDDVPDPDKWETQIFIKLRDA